MRRAARARYSSLGRYGLLLLLAAFLGACARPGDTGRVPADRTRAADTWTRFVQTAERAEHLAGPFRLNATLYYSGKEDSQRVTAYFWGNGDKNTPLPLRLDILMGPGSVMAAAREDSRGLFIHVPRENAVYFAQDGSLLAFDMPVPFALEDLAFLVTGRFGNVFAPATDGVPPAAKGENADIIYEVDTAPLPGFVTIGPDGLPVFWTDGSPDGWTLAIEYWPDSTRTTPRKLYFKHAGGREATIIVRDLAYPDSPYTPGQLELTVPPQTPLVPLDENR